MFLCLYNGSDGLKLYIQNISSDVIMKDKVQQVGDYLKFRYEPFLTITKQREESLLLTLTAQVLIQVFNQQTPRDDSDSHAGVTAVKYRDGSFWSESCRVLTVFPSSTTVELVSLRVKAIIPLMWEKLHLQLD